MDLTTIPDWLGTAVLGAVIAALGYVGTQVFQWLQRLSEEERIRRARLAELLALIRAGDIAWKVQCENRDRLAKSIHERAPNLRQTGKGYDHLFAAAHPTMTENERELHDIVRAITVHTFNPLNKAMLEWLRSDSEFRVRPPDDSDRGKLASFLSELEAHLLLWEAKYKIWIPDHPERALVYLDDEKRHGMKFPQGGADLIRKILHRRQRVRA